jgi:hypothetical protein
VFYLVASDYWQGALPTGVLCRLEVLTPQTQEKLVRVECPTCLGGGTVLKEQNEIAAPSAPESVTPAPDPDALYQPNTEHLEHLLWEFADRMALGLFGPKPDDAVRDLATELARRR